jgi:hypothetical protein
MDWPWYLGIALGMLWVLFCWADWKVNRMNGPNPKTFTGFLCIFGCHKPWRLRTSKEQELCIYECERCGKRYFGKHW